MTILKNIGPVVEADLCTGCGTCFSICPTRAINMSESPSGLLLAQVSPDLCTYCSLCTKVCPGSHLEPGLLPANFNPFHGEVLAAYCGYAIDPEIRRNAQSGGLVTALLIRLLNSGKINKALVTRMPVDGSLRPVSFFAESTENISKAQGSKYCPSATNTALPSYIEKNDSIAMVGIPCQVHGVRNGQRWNQSWNEQIPLIIGLFCDRIMSYLAMDYLIKKANIEKLDVSTFRYKNKLYGKFPGNVSFRNKVGKEYQVSNRYRLECKDAFTPAHCRLCFDKLNVLSDIAVGDAWGVKEDDNGFSVVLARTSKGLELLQSAMESDEIHLEKITREAVFNGQKIDQRIEHWNGFIEARIKRNQILPDFDIRANTQAVKKERILSNYYQRELDWTDKIFQMRNSSEVRKAVKYRIRFQRVKAKLSLRRIFRNLRMRLKSGRDR